MGRGGGVISMTTSDSGKGCLDSSFVFCVCVFGGDEI